MEKRKILLARPNVFIVENMRKMIDDVNCEPLPLQKLEDLDNLKNENIAAVVISTAVSSSIKEKHYDVLRKVRSIMPGIPVIMATLMEVEALKKNLVAILKEEVSGLNFLSIEEALGKSSIDASTDLIIVRNEDLTDKVKHELSQKVFNKVVS